MKKFYACAGNFLWMFKIECVSSQTLCSIGFLKQILEVYPGGEEILFVSFSHSVRKLNRIVTSSFFLL